MKTTVTMISCVRSLIFRLTVRRGHIGPVRKEVCVAVSITWHSLPSVRCCKPKVKFTRGCNETEHNRKWEY